MLRVLLAQVKLVLQSLSGVNPAQFYSIRSRVSIHVPAQQPDLLRERLERGL